MIGKVLFIADEFSQSYMYKLKAEWRKYGFEIDCLDFSTVFACSDLDCYFLVIFSTGQSNIRIYHEYSQLIRTKTIVPFVFLLFDDVTNEDRVEFLRTIADEVICLPDSVSGVVASCIALIRRNAMVVNNATSIVLSDEKIILDVGRYKVIVDGKIIDLRKKEFDILYLLMQNRNIVMTYSTIFKNVWGEEYADNSKSILWNQISALRRKLQWKLDLPQYIISERDIGYKFSPTYE